jgi:hypothetical protein
MRSWPRERMCRSRCIKYALPSLFRFQRHFLSPLQHSARLQPLHRELGSAGVEDRGGHRGHLRARQGTSPGSEAPDNLRKRPTVHCQRLQGIHWDFGHDPSQNFAILSPIERKIERWHRSLKGECIRPGTPLSLEDARRQVKGYVEHYNNVRLNSAISYIAPKNMLAGRQQEIHAVRDRKLEEARKQRRIHRKGCVVNEKVNLR